METEIRRDLFTNKLSPEAVCAKYHLRRGQLVRIAGGPLEAGHARSIERAGY